MGAWGQVSGIGAVRCCIVSFCFVVGGAGQARRQVSAAVPACGIAAVTSLSSGIPVPVGSMGIARCLRCLLRYSLGSMLLSGGWGRIWLNLESIALVCICHLNHVPASAGRAGSRPNRLGPRSVYTPGPEPHPSPLPASTPPPPAVALPLPATTSTPPLPATASTPPLTCIRACGRCRWPAGGRQQQQACRRAPPPPAWRRTPRPACRWRGGWLGTAPAGVGGRGRQAQRAQRGARLLSGAGQPVPHMLCLSPAWSPLAWPQAAGPRQARCQTICLA